LSNQCLTKSNNRKVCEQYNGVAPNFQDGIISSLVSRMMPIADNWITELNRTNYSRYYTDGIAIDIDALAKSWPWWDG
jgi:hypothetical protein